MVRALLIIFAVMIIAGAVISFNGFLLDPLPERVEGIDPPVNPGFGNELAFLLVFFGAIGLVATFTLRGLPNPWNRSG